MSETENQQELTAEQIAELRKNTLHFYKDRIQFLKVQLEFEKLSADIEEEKLRGLMAQLKMAHITAPPQEEQEEESQKPE
jgi:hypothetical protein